MTLGSIAVIKHYLIPLVCRSIRGDKVKALRFFLIIIVLSLALTPISKVNGTGIEIVGHSVVPALAVSMMDNGSYVGTVTWIDARILRPGSGVIYVSTEPLSDIDLQASARAAVLIASYLANIDPFKYDYLISIKASAPIIGGPSAGSAMVVAVYAALTNTSLDPFVAATGMILPDGLIGPVGGVPEKAVAAASQGFKVILVPWGQSIYTEVRYVSQKIGPVAIIRPMSVSINVSDLVKEYSARVIEIATAEDLLYFFTNGSYVPARAVQEPFLTTTEERILSNAFENLSTLLDKAISSASHQVGLIRDQRISSYIDSLILSSNRYYNESRDLYNKGLYYPALSSLFTSYYIAKFAQNLATAYNSQDPAAYARNYISRVSSLIKSYEDLLNIYASKDTYGANEIYVLPEIYRRLYDASDNLNKSMAAIDSGDVASSIYYVSYSEARLESIDPWLQLARLPSVNNVPRDLVGKIASWIYSYADTSLSYLESLLSSISYQSSSQQDLELMLSSAASLLRSGDYLGTISLSTDIILNTTITLHSMFSINISSLGEIVGKEVRKALAEAEVGAGSPVSARLYAQMGEYLSERGQAIQALSLYEQSLLILRIAKLLTQGSQTAMLSSAKQSTSDETRTIPVTTETVINTLSPAIQTTQTRRPEVLPSHLSVIIYMAAIVIILSAALYVYVHRRTHSRNISKE